MNSHIVCWGEGKTKWDWHEEHRIWKRIYLLTTVQMQMIAVCNYQDTVNRSGKR